MPRSLAAMDDDSSSENDQMLQPRSFSNNQHPIEVIPHTSSYAPPSGLIQELQHRDDYIRVLPCCCSRPILWLDSFCNPELRCKYGHGHGYCCRSCNSMPGIPRSMAWLFGSLFCYMCIGALAGVGAGIVIDDFVNHILNNSQPQTLRILEKDISAFSSVHGAVLGWKTKVMLSNQYVDSFVCTMNVFPDCYRSQFCQYTWNQIENLDALNVSYYTGFMPEPAERNPHTICYTRLWTKPFLATQHVNMKEKSAIFIFLMSGISFLLTHVFIISYIGMYTWWVDSARR